MKSTIIFRIRPTFNGGFTTANLFEALKTYCSFEIESKVMTNSKIIIKYDEENMNDLIKSFHHIMGIRNHFYSMGINPNDGFSDYFMGVIGDDEFTDNKHYQQSVVVGINRIKMKNMYVGTKGCNE